MRYIDLGGRKKSAKEIIVLYNSKNDEHKNAGLESMKLCIYIAHTTCLG
jgi:hypothetical protein